LAAAGHYTGQIGWLEPGVFHTDAQLALLNGNRRGTKKVLALRV
jgi:hypothetical protein